MTKLSEASLDLLKQMDDDHDLKVFMCAHNRIFARDLSHKLAIGHVDESSDHYEFLFGFQGRTAIAKMTYSSGHLYQQDLSHRSSRLSPRSILETSVDLFVVNPDRHRPEKVAAVAKGTNAVILWMNCDLEGEAICYEVLDCVKQSLSLPSKKNLFEVFYRAIFASADEAMDALHRLNRPDENKASAVGLKHIYDLLVGVYVSRHQTEYLRKLLNDSSLACLSFGPCQTPCLSIVVAQAEIVEAYRPEYNVMLNLNVNGKCAVLCSSATDNIEHAKALLEKLQTYREKNLPLKVISVTSTSMVKKSPAGLTTSEFFKLISEIHNVSLVDAVNSLQKLYERELISFPRTNSSRFRASLALNMSDYSNMFKNLRQVWHGETKAELVFTKEILSRGECAGDHAPIYPLDNRCTFELSAVDEKVYSLICSRFIATFLKNYCYQKILTTLRIGDIEFNHLANHLIEPGFTKVVPWESENHSEIKFEQDGTYVIDSLNLCEAKDLTPKYISQAELIDKMSSYGIGTCGTIPGYVTLLQSRGYVRAFLQDGCTRLKPTSLGKALIKIYKSALPFFVDPTSRAKVESYIHMVAFGEAKYDQVAAHLKSKVISSCKRFERKFPNLAYHITDLFPNHTTKKKKSITTKNEANALVVLGDEVMEVEGAIDDDDFESLPMTPDAAQISLDIEDDVLECFPTTTEDYQSFDLGGFVDKFDEFVI